MRIYIVTRGRYSDYTICGAYSTLALAEGALPIFDGNGGSESARVEEFPIDEQLPTGNYWEIWMTAEGDILKGDITQVPYSREHKPISQCAGAGFLVYVFGETREGSAKVANEYRIAWKLENE